MAGVADNAVSSAAVLVAATLLAIIWVNSPIGGTYDAFWHLEAGVLVGPYELVLDLKHWVNDGLMALFFFAVGLEVKRELTIGELTDRRRAAVPIVAAIAGLAIPAVIFLAVNAGTAAAHAWGVVVSTDTAFVLALLALVGPKPGTRLRLFLVTLAVADDIGALTIIALFYTESLSWGWLGLGLLGLALVGVLRWLRVRRDGVYLAVGVLTWIAVYQSGVHATLAGVAIALILPVYPPKREAVERVEVVTRAFRQSPSAESERLARRQISGSVAMNERLQVLLRPVIALVGASPLRVGQRRGLPVRGLARGGGDLPAHLGGGRRAGARQARRRPARCGPGGPDALGRAATGTHPQAAGRWCGARRHRVHDLAVHRRPGARRPGAAGPGAGGRVRRLADRRRPRRGDLLPRPGRRRPQRATRCSCCVRSTPSATTSGVGSMRR